MVTLRADELTRLQSVVLHVRPPITVQLSTVSPVLLEELINELSSLGSVYHKPTEAFIGKGRLGAADVQRKAVECAAEHLCSSKSLQNSADKRTTCLASEHCRLSPLAKRQKICSTSTMTRRHYRATSMWSPILSEHLTAVLRRRTR